MANVDARAAEVDFELFGLDGGDSGNAIERVRYRLEAGEVFSMPVDTVFAAAGARGWILGRIGIVVIFYRRDPMRRL